MMKLLGALILFAIFVAASSAKDSKNKVFASAAKKYDGYQVLRIIPKDLEQLENLHNLYDLIEDAVDFWKEPRKVHQPVDIMISPDLVEDVKIELARRGLDFSIYVENVQTNINDERCKDCKKKDIEGFDYTVYHTAEEISQWVTDFAKEQPLVSEIKIGFSYEFRWVKAVKISSEDESAFPGPDGSKRVIYIQGGIHAREWISPATMMYMANMLATNYSTDPKVKAMVDNYDWYIVPSLNIDGYAFSWTQDRLWRKNRQPNHWSRCIGTDLNRNYPYQWGGPGASSNECSDVYHGSSALSATEVSVVHNWLQQFSGHLALFIDFHNYGQLWLYPWGYTSDRDIPQPDKDVQDYLARQGTAALQSKFGTTYFVGMSGPDMYPASGASEDYGYGTLRVKYTYIVELRDEGKYAFMVPESQIEPTGIETFEALKIFGTNPLN